MPAPRFVYHCSILADATHTQRVRPTFMRSQSLLRLGPNSGQTLGLPGSSVRFLLLEGLFTGFKIGFPLFEGGFMFTVNGT